MQRYDICCRASENNVYGVKWIIVDFDMGNFTGNKICDSLAYKADLSNPQVRA